MREKENLNPLNPNTMTRIETLSQRTNGMNPIQFEAYCESNGILIEWLDVTLTDLNDGVYHITLPEYGNRCVFSMNGSPIEVQ